MFIQRPSCARAKHADLISTRLIVHCVTTSPPELYLVRSHRWWETAAEPGPALLRRTGSREPTSTVSPRTEPCHGDTKTLRTLFLWMSSDPLHCFFLFCYHFSTRLSQSPRTATQMSRSPVSLRRWNQKGKKKKKVVCRSATVDARPNRPS